jgi:hypothetical protein
MQVTWHPDSRQSWPPPTPSPTPREQAEETIKFWATVLLVVTIGSILVFRYLLHIWRDSNSGASTPFLFDSQQAVKV